MFFIFDKNDYIYMIKLIYMYLFHSTGRRIFIDKVVTH